MDASRFAREAVLLAEVPHPAIVRYVAHGITPKGNPFLALGPRSRARRARAYT